MVPSDVEQRRQLDSWCAGVGPALVANAGAPAASVRPQDVTFVSWNIHVGNADVDRFVRDLRSGQLTNGRPVTSIVMMLQEAVRLSDVPSLSPTAAGASAISGPLQRQNDIGTLGHRLGMSMAYVPSMRNGRRAGEPAADRGNAILSTMPVVSPTAVELPFERQRRVALFAGIALSATQTMNVGVVHLDALGSPRRLWVFGTPSMRAAEARALQNTLPHGDLIVGADLNSWWEPNEAAVRYLDELIGPSASGERAGLRVLDRVFFRASAPLRPRYEAVDNAYGSDHKPLIGWLE